MHQGGGLRLLIALLERRENEFDKIQLDSRAKPYLALKNPGKVTWIQKSILARLRAEWLLFRECKPGDTLLCFHSLPPIFPVNAKVVVFAQNHLLLSRLPIDQYTWTIRARLHIERIWLTLFSHRTSRFIVQSPTMANLLRQRLSSSVNVRVSPLFDDLNRLSKTQSNRDRSFDFLYVADGEHHKNHRNLLEAWQLLAAESIRPTLALTIDAKRYPELCAHLTERSKAHNLRIFNLGLVPMSEIQGLYLTSGALIYPSTFESFGLPLIEASRTQIPVVASERDFVRDVSCPVHTFDPESPLSIARAVRRFIGDPEQPVALNSPDEFLAEVRKD